MKSNEVKGTKRVICIQCGKDFSNKRSILNRHYTNIHNVDVKLDIVKKEIDAILGKKVKKTRQKYGCPFCHVKKYTYKNFHTRHLSLMTKGRKCPKIPWNDTPSEVINDKEKSQNWTNDILRQMLKAHNRTVEMEETINQNTVLTIEKLLESARAWNISKQGKQGIHFSIRAKINSGQPLKSQEKKLFHQSFNNKYHQSKLLKYFFEAHEKFKVRDLIILRNWMKDEKQEKEFTSIMRGRVFICHMSEPYTKA